MPKRDRNCDWNSNIETALNCETTLKTLKRRSNESEITLTRRSNDPQTTLRRPSNDPPTTSKRPSNDPETALKRASNTRKQSTKPTYTNNYLKRRSDIAQSALTRPLYTLRPSPCPTPSGFPVWLPFGVLKTLGLKRSKLLPGRSWLYWGASTPQKLSHTCLRPVRRA